jgi:serine/threonine-protein kinase
MPLAPGRQLGPYRILAPLGAGGMGEVYRARDEQLRRDVAIKVLPDRTSGSSEAVARFEREARAVAALSHPNIVAVHNLGSEGELRYLVMELLEGETLHERLRRGPLPAGLAAQTAARAADALAAAHDRGVIHRDVKPSNVFLTRDGGVKVLDFGLARAAETRFSDDSPTEVRTRTGVILGTLGYMSPEQLSGEEVDSRADVFSLGCVLHEMLTGTGPFRRSSATATAAATLSEPPPELGPAVPPELGRVVSRCLEKDRESRYHSARDLALDLRALPAGSAPGPPVVSPSAGAPRAARRFRVRYAAGAALVVLALAVVGFLVQRALGRRAGPTVSSLAVLPFENADRREETEYLVDGLTEGLINTLAQLPEIRVVARTTAFRYKGKPLDLERVRRELGVDAVLSGRVSEREGGHVVQADLVDLRTGAQLWGRQYRVQDEAAIERTIASDVGRRLRSSMTPNERARLDARHTSSNEAYLEYLEGRYDLNKRNRQRILLARDHFRRAIDLDPTFALAHVGLADSYTLMGGQFRLLPQREALANAETAARRALEIDAQVGAAHASLGLILMNQFRFKSAERELRAAIELDPNYVMARIWSGLLLAVTGRREEALAQLRRAQAVDPLAPHVAANTAMVLNASGDHDGAFVAARRVLDLDPEYPFGFWNLAMVYEARGQYAEAADAFRHVARNNPSASRAYVARMDAKLGRAAQARRVARELEGSFASGEVAPTHIAVIYSALHDTDRALAWLEKGLATWDVALRDNIDMVTLSELRGEPRFEDLHRRMLSVEP